jgi:hypothetical protein
LRKKRRSRSNANIKNYFFSKDLSQTIGGNKQMGSGLGKIQKRILEVLKTIEERYIEKESREKRWVWLNILIIKTYHPNQLEGDKRNWNWGYSVNEHRRIWESVKGLEKRGLVETRIVKAKELGLRMRFGGCTRWMEIRVR